MTRPRRRVEVIHTGGCFTLPVDATAPHRHRLREMTSTRGTGLFNALATVAIGREVTFAIARRPTLRPAPKVYGSLVLGLRPTRTMRRRVGALWSCLSPRPSFNVLGSGIRNLSHSLVSLIALLSFFFLIWLASCATCKPRAISVPFKGNRISTNAEVRGVTWQIGGPNAQNITLMPSA
jgi:hypothetical protein